MSIAGWLRGLAGRVSFGPFRLVAFLLHVTGLEYIYKPQFLRASTLDQLDDKVVARLPKYCYTVTGARMDPVNLVFVGTDRQLKMAFKAAGWHRAHPASPLHLLYGLMTYLTRRPYHSGPFTPFFVNIGLQDLSFQKTLDGKFSHRHHMRVWKTGVTLPNGKRVWVAAASLDVNLKIQPTYPFVHHSIDPNLDAEREFIVEELLATGARRVRSVPMTQPVLASKSKANAYGSRYFTDGRAVVVELA